MSRFAEDIARIREELASGGSAGAGPRFAEDVDAIRRDLQTARPVPVDGFLNLPPLTVTEATPISGPAADGIRTRTDPLPPIMSPDLRREQERGQVFMRAVPEGVPVAGPTLRAGADRAVAGVRSLVTGQPYADELQAFQSRADALAQAHPDARTAGNVVGSVISTAPAIAAAPAAFGLRTGAGLGERIIMGGLSTGGLAAADTAARGGSTQDVVESGVAAGLVGGVVSGVVVPAIARLTGSVSAARTNGRPTTVEELETHARRLYQSADAAGIQVRPHSFASIVAWTGKQLKAKGYDPRLHPHVAPVLQIQNEVVAAGQPISLRQLETMRRQAISATRSVDPALADERRIAGIIVEGLDGYMSKLSAAQIANRADPKAATAALREARGYWRRASVADRISIAMEQAETHSSGLATGLRSSFASLSKDKRFMRSLTAEEKRAVKDLASVANFRGLLTLAAKMDPHRSILGASISIGGGGFAGGPVGAVAGYAVGRGAAAMSDRVMRNRALAVQRGVIRGSQAKPFDTRTRTLAGALGLSATLQGQK